MKTKIYVNHEERRIEYNKAFAACITNPRSEEYALLQAVRKDYPDYTIEKRTIKRNSNKKTYKGLSYEYMEDYIKSHETKETLDAVLAEFEEKRLIGKCHRAAYSYATIKEWFLGKYPEIKTFGCAELSNPKEEKPAEAAAENKDTNVVNLKPEETENAEVATENFMKSAS